MARRKLGSARPKEEKIIPVTVVDEKIGPVVIGPVDTTEIEKEIALSKGEDKDEVQSEDAEIPEEVVPAEQPTDAAPDEIVSEEDLENVRPFPEVTIKVKIDADEAIETLKELENITEDFDAQIKALEAKRDAKLKEAK